MVICFFGNYIKDYPRIQVLKKGLIENGIDVIECHTRKTGWAKFLELYRQHKKLKNKYDLLLVGMGGYTLVWLAKLLTSQKVIFDAFVSQYLTNVEDRHKVPAKSLTAKYYSFIDKYSCKLADMVLLDTQAQIDYFVSRYKLKPAKFRRVFVSTDDDIFYPINNKQQTTNNKFIIHWHGYIVPFYGLEIIIKAAESLKHQKDIEFRLITRFDSKYKKIKSVVDDLGLNNIKFYPETSYEGLARAINNSDLCLGVFGENPKARVVIPNKIFEAIACGRPVLTARHKVLEELFTNQENILLCKPNNVEDLMQKILQLKSDKDLQKKLGQNAFLLYQKKLKSKILGAELISYIDFSKV